MKKSRGNIWRLKGTIDERKAMVFRSALCYTFPGSNEQPALSGYDRITFACFHNCRRRVMASWDALHQPTGVFVSARLLTEMLQVRILFGEPHQRATGFGGPSPCQTGDPIA